MRAVILRSRCWVRVVTAAVLLVASPSLAVGAFSPSVFKFEVDRKDDGKDRAVAGRSPARSSVSLTHGLSFRASGHAA